MLLELRVKNLLLIEEADLTLSPGLNVLTGETGAGKTILAHALDLLLGGRPRSGVVRPGASEALVEGIFELAPGIRSELPELVDEDDSELILARQVKANGRTRAIINGRTATVGDLRVAAESLLSFYGQHEHRRLTVGSAQLEILDSFCGDAQAARLARCAEVHAKVVDAERKLAELDGIEGGRERELDLLRYELDEIDASAPSVEQEAELVATQGRLANVEALRLAAARVVEALDGVEGEGACGALASGQAATDAVAGTDDQLDRLGERLAAAALEAGDIAAEARGYLEGLAGDPEELSVIEARLSEWDRLKRKHGGTLEAVLEYAEQARQRIELLEGSSEAISRIQGELAQAADERHKVSEELHRARKQAGQKLSQLVEGRLEALAMPGARFEIALTEREPGPTGSDDVDFMVAANPGVPAGPIREIASGGELSRVMLALLGLASDGSGATLVFDEIDAGIGGQTANAVADQLRGLAEGRQVICITHLPQVAALAAHHFSISKDSGPDGSETTVTALDGEDVVAELVRMLGAEPGDRAATEHARQLRNGASSPQAAAA